MKTIWGTDTLTLKEFEEYEKGISEGLEIASRFIQLLNEEKFSGKGFIQPADVRDEIAKMILELRSKP